MALIDDEVGDASSTEIPERVVFQERRSTRSWVSLTIVIILAVTVVLYWAIFFANTLAAGTPSQTVVSSDPQVDKLQSEIDDLHHESDRLISITGATFGVIVD